MKTPVNNLLQFVKILQRKMTKFYIFNRLYLTNAAACASARAYLLHNTINRQPGPWRRQYTIQDL